MARPPVRPPSSEQLDLPAFEGLYRDYEEAIYRFVRRAVRDPQDADDVCQEVWARVYVGVSALREPAAARGWIYRIARHAVVDAARRRSRLPRQTPLTTDAPGRVSDDPAQLLLSDERASFVWQALAALNQRQRMALYLKEFEDLRYTEIAVAFDCSVSAVETLLFRARRRFAERYGCLSESQADRCEQARITLAVVLDGEGDVVQEQGVQAHLSECAVCREVLTGARQTYAARATVALLPIPLAAPSGFTVPGFIAAACRAVGGASIKVATSGGGAAAGAVGMVVTSGAIAFAATGPVASVNDSLSLPVVAAPLVLELEEEQTAIPAGDSPPAALPSRAESASRMQLTVGGDAALDGLPSEASRLEPEGWAAGPSVGASAAAAQIRSLLTLAEDALESLVDLPHVVLMTLNGLLASASSLLGDALVRLSDVLPIEGAIERVSVVQAAELPAETFEEVVESLPEMVEVAQTRPADVEVQPLPQIVEGVKPPSGAVDEVAEPLFGTLKELAEPLSGTEEVAESLSGPLEEVAESLSGPLEEVAEPLSGAVEEVAESLSGPLEELAEPLSEAGEEVAEPLSGAVDELAEPLSLPGR